MPYFYISRNKNAKNFFEIHKSGCPLIREKDEFESLGYSMGFLEASIEAKNRNFYPINCCEICLPKEHSSKKRISFK